MKFQILIVALAAVASAAPLDARSAGHHGKSVGHHNSTEVHHKSGHHHKNGTHTPKQKPHPVRAALESDGSPISVDNTPRDIVPEEIAVHIKTRDSGSEEDDNEFVARSSHSDKDHKKHHKSHGHHNGTVTDPKHKPHPTGQPKFPKKHHARGTMFEVVGELVSRHPHKAEEHKPKEHKEHKEHKPKHHGNNGTSEHKPHPKHPKTSRDLYEREEELETRHSKEHKPKHHGHHNGTSTNPHKPKPTGAPKHHSEHKPKHPKQARGSVFEKVGDLTARFEGLEKPKHNKNDKNLPPFLPGYKGGEDLPWPKLPKGHGHKNGTAKTHPKPLGKPVVLD